MSVALAADRPADQTILTRLCGPDPLAGRVLHVLISGATYGSLAWDFPYQPERYSYVRALNRAGVATLNLDRLGIGASSHPDSADVNIDSHIFIYHQLISAARSGALRGRLRQGGHRRAQLRIGHRLRRGEPATPKRSTA